MTEYKITEDIISTDDSGINEYEYTVWEIDGFDETIMCKTIAEIPYYPNLIVKGLEKLESELKKSEDEFSQDDYDDIGEDYDFERN